MTNVAIADDLNLLLEQEAQQSGVTKNELLEDIIRARVVDESLPLSALTDKQLTRFTESVEALKRGETITMEEVNARFEAMFLKIKSR